MTIALSDGRSHLCQWDTGRQLVILDLPEEAQVHLARKEAEQAHWAAVTREGAVSTAPIPDELLQTEGELCIYIYLPDKTGGYTRHGRKSYEIRPRPKPADYVYTPTETALWTKLEGEISRLDSTKTNHAEAKEAARLYLTANQVDWGQYDASKPDYIKNRTHGPDLVAHEAWSGTMALTASGERYVLDIKLRFSSALKDTVTSNGFTSLRMSFWGQSGDIPVCASYVVGSGLEPWGTLSGRQFVIACDKELAYDGTSWYYAAQIVSTTAAGWTAELAFVLPGIRQLDEQYIPAAIARTATTDDHESRLAALEAGGGGGGDKWELIADVTLEEKVSSFSIDQDMNGEAFLLRKYWLAYTWAQVTDGSEISNAWFLVENGRQFEDGQPPLYTSAFEPASASGKKSGYIVAELLPNNVLWEQNYRCNADSFVILEPFSPLNAPVTNVLKYTVMKQRDAYEPFYQIGGNNLSIPVGSRIMLWGVRV